MDSIVRNLALGLAIMGKAAKLTAQVLAALTVASGTAVGAFSQHAAAQPPGFPDLSDFSMVPAENYF
jgi:hypothetical protein